jgi:hypothetical protein
MLHYLKGSECRTNDWVNLFSDCVAQPHFLVWHWRINQSAKLTLSSALQNRIMYLPTPQCPLLSLSIIDGPCLSSPILPRAPKKATAAAKGPKGLVGLFGKMLTGSKKLASRITIIGSGVTGWIAAWVLIFVFQFVLVNTKIHYYLSPFKGARILWVSACTAILVIVPMFLEIEREGRVLAFEK